LRQQGFVLIFVLLTIVSLAGMLALLRLEAFREARLSRTPVVERTLRLSLPGLAAWCRIRALSDEEETEEREKTETPEVECDLKDFKVRAVFSSEGKRLNLNKASREDLLNFFEEEGFSPERAEVMAESLLDWIDGDNEHRPSGAEEDFYAPRGYQPRNGPLAYLDEVVLVRGFDPYVFWIEPGLYREVTIYAAEDKEEKEPLSLSTPGVYRQEMEISFRGLKWRYLEVFEAQGANRFQVLYRRLLPDGDES